MRSDAAYMSDGVMSACVCVGAALWVSEKWEGECSNTHPIQIKYV